MENSNRPKEFGSRQFVLEVVSSFIFCFSFSKTIFISIKMIASAFISAPLLSCILSVTHTLLNLSSLLSLPSLILTRERRLKRMKKIVFVPPTLIKQNVSFRMNWLALLGVFFWHRFEKFGETRGSSSVRDGRLRAM